MPRNSAGYTPAVAPPPPYVNIGLEGDEVSITVRSPATPGGFMGPAASMTLPLESFRAMLAGVDGLLP